MFKEGIKLSDPMQYRPVNQPASAVCVTGRAAGRTYMLADAVLKAARKQLEGSSPQRLLLPLTAEHEQLLLLLLAEGVTVPHLGSKRT